MAGLLTVLTAALQQPPVLLVDNGSKRPASTLALRQTALALQAALGGREVLPVSLRWSDTVPAVELGGVEACVLGEALHNLEARGETRAILAPLFLGPSASLSSAVRKSVAKLVATGSKLDLHVGKCLVDEAHADDLRVARAMASLVLRTARAKRLRLPLQVPAAHG